MAHSYVGIVAADEDLPALRDDFALSVDTGVDDCFLSASANGFDFGDGIRHLEKPSAPLKQVG